MKKITYLQRGTESNFRRVGDRLETVILYRCWRVGGLLYGYRDLFNIVTIPIEDIRKTEEA